jgi:hypothetical protein
MAALQGGKMRGVNNSDGIRGWFCFSCFSAKGKQARPQETSRQAPPEQRPLPISGNSSARHADLRRLLYQGAPPQNTAQKTAAASGRESAVEQERDAASEEFMPPGLFDEDGDSSWIKALEKRVGEVSQPGLEKLLMNGEAYIDFGDGATRRVPPNRQRTAGPDPAHWIDTAAAILRPYTPSPANLVSVKASMVFDEATGKGGLRNAGMESWAPVAETGREVSVPVQIFRVDGKHLVPQPTHKACLTACAHMLLLDHGCETAQEAVDRLSDARRYDRRLETEDIVAQLQQQLAGSDKKVLYPPMPNDRDEFLQVLQAHLKQGPAIVDNGGHAMVLDAVRKEENGDLLLSIREPFHGAFLEVKNSQNPRLAALMVDNGSVMHMADIDIFGCRPIFLKNGT